MDANNLPTHDSGLLPDTQLLESLGVALIVLDNQYRVLRFNGPAAELTGYGTDRALGRSCAELFCADQCHAGCPLRVALASGTSHRIGTSTVQTASGLPMTVEITASALCNDRGEVTGAVGLLRDATEVPGQVQVIGRCSFVSRTKAMRQLFDSLPQLATSSAPLLIAGGRGSGRSAFAETVHALGHSGRPGPLHRFSCEEAAGREAKRFLDRLAVDRPAFDPDDREGATLLLEEVDAAPSALQRSLIAWLDDHPEPPRARLISTASAESEGPPQRGELWRDLFYRLAVLQVALPDLAERVDDIPLLVDQFVEAANLAHDRAVRGVSPRAMRRMVGAHYSQNVRELREVINLAHARCRGDLIKEEDLPSLTAARPLLPDVPRPWAQRKAELEREAIGAALQRNRGNVTRAAQELRMHRTTLWRKMKRHGIHP